MAPWTVVGYTAVHSWIAPGAGACTPPHGCVVAWLASCLPRAPKRGPISFNYNFLDFFYINRRHNSPSCRDIWRSRLQTTPRNDPPTILPINTLGLKQNGRNFAEDIFYCIFFSELFWTQIYACTCHEPYKCSHMSSVHCREIIGHKSTHFAHWALSILNKSFTFYGFTMPMYLIPVSHVGISD